MTSRIAYILPLFLLACGDAQGVPVTPRLDQGALIKCAGPAAVGNNASTFELASVNGGGTAVVKPGRVVIVDFWATWCEPCEKSFPRFQELYEKYKDQGLDFVAVSVDERNDNINVFAKRYAVTFPVVWDAGKKIASCYTPPNVPATYLIDRSGVIRFMQDRYNDGDESELERQIQKLL